MTVLPFVPAFSPSSGEAVVPGPQSPPAAVAGDDGDLSPDAAEALAPRPYSPDVHSTRQLLRPVDLRPGDILAGYDRAVVTAFGMPCRHRGEHWYRVPTSKGPKQWPLADASRFRNLVVHRSLHRPIGVGGCDVSLSGDGSVSS